MRQAARTALVRAITHHRLNVPPHDDGYYASSALCACGNWQWDGPSADFVRFHSVDVWADWFDHVRTDPEAADAIGVELLNPDTVAAKLHSLALGCQWIAAEDRYADDCGDAHRRDAIALMDALRGES